MTIQKVIQDFETVMGHQVPAEMVIGWLSDADTQIYRDLICWHEMDVTELERYSVDDMTTELLVPEPYTDVYMNYLSMRVNFYNNEIQRYNNSAMAFHKALDNYSAYLNRKYLPKQEIHVRI